MKRKPEISWNYDTDQFEQDGNPITVEKARERWDAIDSDWTSGAYNRMMDIVFA